MISFLQSPEWEEFQKSLGRKTWRVNDALIIRHDLPGGVDYLYCPRPNFENQEDFSGFLAEAKVIAREQKAVFLKIDPLHEIRFPAKYVYRESRMLQPRRTVILNLRKSIEELGREMHEKTRYNIRLAERAGVEVTQVLSRDLENDFKVFWQLLQETTDRQGFSSNEKEYYQKLFSVRSHNFSNQFFFAVFRRKTIAAAVINFYEPGRTAAYLHGASTREQKQIMAPHLLHWTIIQAAKARGFERYDFWGIDEKRWPGVTRFKLGFGGEIVEFPPAVDVVFRPRLYRLYKFVNFLRAKI